MGVATTRGVGQYAAGSPSEAHMAGWDRLYKPGTGRGVIWLHAKGDDDLEPWGLDAGGASASRTVASAITAAQFPVMGIDAAGDAWGNDASQALAGQAKTYLQGTLGAKTTGPIILAAVSMGALLALNWARANPTLVQAILLFYPATSLQALHDGTGGASDFHVSIEAAYGGLAGFNAAVATHDPSQNASAYAGVPIKAWYSSNDTAVGTANQTAFFTAVGGSALQTVNMGDVTHPDMTQPVPSDVAAYCLANA